jgi:uncharacterized protein YjbI with pentapeptide repeats
MVEALLCGFGSFFIRISGTVLLNPNLLNWVSWIHMANDAQVALIKQGTEIWNAWRKENPSAAIDLRRAYLEDIDLPNVNLSNADLYWAYLRNAQLSGANLSHAQLEIIDLSKADLQGANLSGARLAGGYLREANLSNASLHKARLVGVNFNRAVLTNANLEGANLRNAVLVDTDLTNANLNGGLVYGAGVWNAKTDGAKQENLVITDKEPTITVDNLKLAQFIYLMIDNAEIRDVIDTVTTKMVLILGRFTSERKKVLDALRQELRHRNYVSVVFDFGLPNSRDADETVNLLARMARFVIADISDPRSVPQELKGIIEALPSVPVQPILSSKRNEYAMFARFKRYPWVLKPFRYGFSDEVSAIAGYVIGAAEAKLKEIRGSLEVKNE